VGSGRTWTQGNKKNNHNKLDADSRGTRRERERENLCESRLDGFFNVLPAQFTKLGSSTQNSTTQHWESVTQRTGTNNRGRRQERQERGKREAREKQEKGGGPGLLAFLEVCDRVAILIDQELPRERGITKCVLASESSKKQKDTARAINIKKKRQETARAINNTRRSTRCSMGD
jgi:hypothetical protein